jgi:hypothetical protein
MNATPPAATVSLAGAALTAPKTAAAWVIDPAAKTATLALYGGQLVLSRRADTQKLAAVFTLDVAAKPAEAEAGKPPVAAAPASSISVQIPLHHIATVAKAQVEAIALLDHTLTMNGQTFHTEAIEADAGPDPF